MLPTPPARIAAVVAAAGRSTRMGVPKQLLSWHGSTVIATVAQNLTVAGADPVIVALGYEAEAVAAALIGTAARTVHNPRYRESEMLSSFQAGLATLIAADYAGALLALGDQPHVPADVLRTIIDGALSNDDAIIVPSHNMRRGHPICLPASLWDEALALRNEETLRTLLDRQSQRIRYVNVESPTVLRDMDNPDDYKALHG